MVGNNNTLLVKCLPLCITSVLTFNRLGQNASLILVFYQFIADRFKEGDYSGSLITRILEVYHTISYLFLTFTHTVSQLMARCITLDQAVLEKTKFDKVLPRLIKRGDSKVKDFAQTILDNAAALAKRKAQTSSDAKDSSIKERMLPKPSQPSKLPPEPVLVSKRPKEGERSSVLPQRRAAPLAATAGSRALGLSKSTGTLSKRPSVSTAETKAATSGSLTSVAKPKTNHIAAKPSGFFSSLQSASKKPGTSNAAVQAAQQKDAKAG